MVHVKDRLYKIALEEWKNDFKGTVLFRFLEEHRELKEVQEVLHRLIKDLESVPYKDHVPTGIYVILDEYKKTKEYKGYER